MGNRGYEDFVDKPAAQGRGYEQYLDEPMSVDVPSPMIPPRTSDRKSLAPDVAERMSPEDRAAWNALRPMTSREENVAGMRTAAMAMGAMAGGIGLPAAVRYVAPAVMGPWTAPVVAGAGEALGQYAVDVGTGGDIKQALLSAALTGGLGAGTQYATQGAGWIAGRFGGVPTSTLRETISRGPIDQVNITRPFPFRAPGPDAELKIAESVRDQLHPAQTRPGGVNLEQKTPGRNRAEAKMRAFDKQNPGPYDPYNVFPGRGTPTTSTERVVTPSDEPPSVSVRTSVVGSRTREAVQNPTINEMLGLDRPSSNEYGNTISGQSVVSDVTTTPAAPNVSTRTVTHPASANVGRGSIDTTPIKTRILSMVKSTSLESGQQNVNKYLTDKANALPQRMTMADLDQFIVEHSRPLSASFGSEQVPLPKEVGLNMVSAARRVRNVVLPGARADFAEASRQLNSMRAVAKRLLTKTGEVSESAESAIKGILKRRQFRKVLQTYEQNTGHEVVKRAEDLTMQRHWTREDARDAGGMMTAVREFFARPAAKLLILGAQPAGVGAAGLTAAAQADKSERQRKAFEAIMRNP